MTGPWTLAVDFGTTSTVAAMGRDGQRSEVLEVDGNRKMPSMIVIDQSGTVVVGVAAAGLARSMPSRTIRTPKNRLGDPVPVVLGGTPFQPVSFVTSILEHVLADAIRFQGSAPTRSRLTYPATWNRPKRARLLEAAVKAGYPAPELVAEPIAAALSYADSAALAIGDHVVVYDLGGGTFDTVVLLRTEEGFTVVGRPLGDAQLGGELFDEILMNFVGEQIDPDSWDQLLVSDDPSWMRAASRLRSECKRAKEALSTHPVAEVSIGLPSGGVDVSITRDQLDELITPFIDESLELLAQCLSDAGQTAESISAIYVTGGASRMPVVERAIKAVYTSTPVSRRGDPKVAVALGALLAIPGSLDASLMQAPERTTVDKIPDVAAPPPPAPQPATEASTPKAPIADVVTPVPEAPHTPTPLTSPTVAPPAAPPEQPHIAQATPAAAAPVSPPQQPAPVYQAQNPGAQHAGIQNPVVQSSAVPNYAAPPQAFAPPSGQPSPPTSGGISTKVVLISLFAVLAIVGAIAATTVILMNRDDTAPTTRTTTSSSDDDPDRTTTSTTTTTTTVDRIDDTELRVPVNAELRASLLTVDDLGPDWQLADGTTSETDDNLCGLVYPIEALFEESVTYSLIIGTKQLTSNVSLFDSSAEASQIVTFDAALGSNCPNPVIRFSETEDMLGQVVPLSVVTDDETVEVEFPAISEGSATVAYRFSVASQASFNAHILAVDIQVGRAVGTVVLLTAGDPEVVDIELLNRTVAITAENLLEAQS